MNAIEGYDEVVSAVEPATTLDSGGFTGTFYPSLTMPHVKTEFKSSNRDLEQNEVLVTLRIAPGVAVGIVSTCSASRLVDYATNGTLFDDDQTVGLTQYTTLGPQDVVFKTPYTFVPGDETRSQWVYYRFVDLGTSDTGSEVFEIEIEDIYRYGWVAASSEWQTYFTSITSANRNAMYVFAHEDNTSVRVTDLTGTVTTVVLDKWGVTSPGLLVEAVSVRATNPIQMGGDVQNERYYIEVSIRDTKFMIPNHNYGNVHDQHIYVHHDNTTVSFSTTHDYRDGVPPKVITYGSKGLYSIRWGTATNLSGSNYDRYHRLISGTSGIDVSAAGTHIIWADKPISGISASGSGRRNIAWMPPTNTKAFTLDWTRIRHSGWWCFDDPNKYENTSMQFQVLHAGTSSSSPSHTLSLNKYTAVNNWSGTSDSSPYAIQLQDSVLKDVFFSIYTEADGAGGCAGMSFSATYASTAYAQVLHISGGDPDRMYVFSLDAGDQSVQTVTINSSTRQEISTTSTSYTFTHNFNQFGAGVRTFSNSVSPSSNTVYRTSSNNTFLGPYVNVGRSRDREGWKTGNMPHVRDVLFSPLVTPGPLVTVGYGMDTTILAVGSSWLTRDNYRYSSVPPEFDGALSLKYTASAIYNNVSFTCHHPVRVMAWAQDWIDLTLQESILLGKGFAPSSDKLVITGSGASNNFSFNTYYRAYSAGDVFTFDTLGAFGGGAAGFIYLAFVKTHEAAPIDLSDTHFDYSSALTYGADGVLSSLAKSHALSKTAYTLPLYVEGEIKANTQTATLLLADAMGAASDSMNQIDDSVAWGCSLYGGGRLVVSTDGANSREDSSRIDLRTFAPAEMDTYRKFSIRMSRDLIVTFIDDVEEYRFVRGQTTALFPDWAVLHGSVRVGVYSSSGGDQFRNLKVGSLYSPLPLHQPPASYHSATPNSIIPTHRVSRSTIQTMS